MTAVDDVSGPEGQILGGLHPKEVSLDAESRARPRGKKQFCPRVGGTPIWAGVDETGRIKEKDDVFIEENYEARTSLLCPTNVLQ